MIAFHPHDTVRPGPAVIRIGLRVSIRPLHDAADGRLIRTVDLAHGIDELLVPVSDLRLVLK